MILDLGTTSFGNSTLFTQPKENDTVLKHFGPMYIGFYEYPTYSGTISENFETNVNVNIQCDCGHAYSSSKVTICTWINEES